MHPQLNASEQYLADLIIQNLQATEELKALLQDNKPKHNVAVIDIAKQVYHNKKYVIKACDDLKIKRIIDGGKTAVTPDDYERVIEYIQRKAS